MFAAGCIDGGSGEPGSHESSTESAVTTGPDLIESAVSDPPATGTPGLTFAVTDTVQNTGTVDAGATFTKYYLSTDGTMLQFLLGNRSVGAITAGSSDTGMGSLKIPVNTHGTYFVVACADSGPGAGGRTSQVTETNENNNCKASTGTITVSAPDLVESNVSTSPASIDAATGTLTITDTVTNSGDADAAASVTRWFLSTDTVKDAADGFIRNCTNGGAIPGRNVGPVTASGGTDTGSASTTPLCVRDANGLHAPAVGTYYVIACADQTTVVGESNENNNCTASSNTVVVTSCGNSIIETGETCDDGNAVSGDGCSSTCQIEGNSDLTASAVSNPPASASVGGTFTITDSITNISTNGAPASTTYYYLSLDTIRNGNDKQLTGSRAVPAVNAGATNSGSATVTVATGTGPGPWYVLACADGPNTVAETNETNNCIASTTQISIVGPDLVISAISDPPATAAVGSVLNIQDTTANTGAGDAGASHTKFYLSPDGAFLQFYLGTRNVPALTAGTSQTATTALTVQSGTASGTYRVVACADAGPGAAGRSSEVAETNENNNCTASAGSVTIGAPDLLITAISNPPATGTIGTTFTITDTTSNGGTTDTGTFFNKYYLSANGTSLLYYVGTASAGALPAGQSETVTTTGSIRTGTAPGTYFLVGCADAGPGLAGRTSQIPETNENNNCTASATQITVN